MTSELLQGQALEWIWGPWHEEGQSGARVGFNNVVEIEVSRLAGPMGFYDVAVICRDDGTPEEIMPIHMAESLSLARGTEKATL